MSVLVDQLLSALLLMAFAASAYWWFQLLRRRWQRRRVRPAQQTLEPQQAHRHGETPYAPPAAPLSEASVDASADPDAPAAAAEGPDSALVPLVPRERPFWGPSDFLIWLGVMLVASVLFQTAFGAGESPKAAAPLPAPEVAEAVETPPEDAPAETTVGNLQSALIVHSLASITATLIALGVLRLKNRRAFFQLGLIPGSGDLRLGLAASLLILPPVMLLMGAMNIIVPYEHPVLDLLTAAPSFTLFAWLFVSTVLITPVVEEFALRVVLQGGLQSLADARSSDPSAQPGRRWRPRAWWPIVVTSLFFAVLHAGQGLAPIPLFFLALGLGYLYRQTGRLYPPLVVHMMLNGITMIVTFTELSSL